jgi:hypothetical protein
MLPECIFLRRKSPILASLTVSLRMRLRRQSFSGSLGLLPGHGQLLTERGIMSDEISRKYPRLLKNLATLNWETGEIIPATDLIGWAIWLQQTDNHVGYDEISGFIVSTASLLLGVAAFFVTLLPATEHSRRTFSAVALSAVLSIDVTQRLPSFLPSIMSRGTNHLPVL